MLWSTSFRSYAALQLLLLLLLITVQGGSCALFGKIKTPIGHEYDTRLPITVNSLTSNKGLLPYNFYSVKTCRPDQRTLPAGTYGENIGEIILGNRIMPSVYSVFVGRNVSCQPICVVSYTKGEMEWLDKLIRQRYRAHMFLDGLPVVQIHTYILSKRPIVGYLLGHMRFKESPNVPVIYNHLNFTIRYTMLDTGIFMITGFYVTPTAIRGATGCPAADGSNEKGATPTVQSRDIPYSYSVSWVEGSSDDVFVTRWDVYASAGQYTTKKGHWMAVFNSLVLLSFFGVLLLVILARTVRRDFLLNADSDVADELQNESGWKLVRGDVFRPPPNSLILCAFVSTGSQGLMMIVASTLLSVLGVLHPSQRGNLFTGLIVLFCFSSVVSGYVAGRMLKFFRKQSWRNGFTAVTLVPCLFLFGYLFVDILSWIKHATTAIPLGTLMTVLFLWIVLPIPLATLGLSSGFHTSVIEVPVKVSSIPRIIPENILKKHYLYYLCGGLVPFTAAFVEIVYVLGSFWQGEPFRFLGYLAAIAFIITIICAELAVVVTYAMLSEENYHWWWGSFLTSGSLGFHFFFYSFFYLISVLEVRQFFPMIIFCVSTLGVSFILTLVMGAIGFLASAFFVKAIYGAIKAD